MGSSYVTPFMQIYDSTTFQWHITQMNVILSDFLRFPALLHHVPYLHRYMSLNLVLGQKRFDAMWRYCLAGVLRSHEDLK